MKKKKGYIITVIIVLVALGGWYWKSKSSADTKEVQYVTATAEKGMLTTSVAASGNVTVDQLATVDPTITGTVANLSVKVGDQVKEGQTLFTIINDQLSVDVTKSEASYIQAKNSLSSKELSVDDAEATYEAAKKKDKADGTTYTSDQLEVLEDKIDIAEEDVTLAEKNVSSAYATYQNTLKDAAKRKVTAPISGTVNEINIKNGDDLSRSSSNSDANAPIIIGDLGTLKATVSVNEVDIAKVFIDQKAMLKFDSLDGLSVSGKVEKIDALGTITQGVVTYDVTIGFDSLDERIKPEMSVSASIITDVKQDVITVPSSAVKTEGNNTYVEVLSGTTPEQKSVQVGATNNTDTEIKSGLAVGDKVVTQTIDPSAASSSSSSSSGGIRVPGLSGGGGGR